MNIEKTVVCRLTMPYAIAPFAVDGVPCVACATEDHGPILWIAPPYEEARELVPGPGGCMAIVPDPERPPELYAIMGCFPGYQFQGAGIYHLTRSAGGSGSWTAARVADLPFAHRMDLVRRGARRYLLAANLAQDKSSPADWAHPGGLWVAAVESRPDLWRLAPVMEGIHRNHGLLRCRFEGRDSLLVSGTEGLFAIDLQSPDGSWPSRSILGHEISEMAVFDLDGDGAEELATIEPFHGDRLRVYHRNGSAWRPAWEAELSFGHGMLAGTFGGRRCLLVSNRSGSRDLLLFEFPKGRGPERTVIDRACGAANLLLLSAEGRDHLFATNQAAGEIVRYSVEAG